VSVEVNEHLRWPPANFGPNETDKACPTCGEYISRVYGHNPCGSILIRYRQCRKCQHRWQTSEDSTPLNEPIE